MQKVNFRERLIKAGVIVAGILPTLVVAEDQNLTDAVNKVVITSDGFWAGVSIVLGAIGTFTAVKYVMRLLKRA